MFPIHPVLKARLRVRTLNAPVRIWTLPKSFDRFMNDPQTLEQSAKTKLLAARHKITCAIQCGDLDELVRKWTEIAEQSLASSVVTCDGEACDVAMSHLGRGHCNPLKTVHRVVPTSRPARAGDLQPSQDQCSVTLRRQMKQAHRLQSLVRQLAAVTKAYNQAAFSQCQVLWLKILNARRLPCTFQDWIIEHVGFAPAAHVPSVDFVVALKDAFLAWFKNNEQKAKLAKTNMKRIDLLEDLRKGAKIAFDAVKVDIPPPITSLTKSVVCLVRRMRWTKEGFNFGGGLPRSFQLRPKDDPFEETLLYLEDEETKPIETLSQKHYRHRVPPEEDKSVETSEEPRINLTWRWIVQHDSGCLGR
eukprot:Skav224229  [mRNA]  locus=scaffold939:1191763:1201797:+ [translate_table: standard]